MASFRREVFTLAHLLRLWDKGELVLQPKFQRREFWPIEAKSFLIDTILRNLPMPKVYLRRGISEETGRLVYEVIDGQQRLSACVAFRDGSLRLMEKHKLGFGNSSFDKLPEPYKRTYREYEFSLEIMENASEQEVWAMFERLNTYTFTLNKQERINAHYFGYFKQMAYQLSAEKKSLDIWLNLKIFTNYQIARMKEVELTADILAAILEGISDRKNIEQIYIDYDEKIPYEKKIRNRFRDAISYLCDEFGTTIRNTRFKSKTGFYSLMVAAYDVLFEIPKGLGPNRFQPSDVINRRLRDIDKALKMKDLPPRLSQLFVSMYSGTGHIRERNFRHKYFFDMFTMPDTQWKENWL